MDPVAALDAALAALAGADPAGQADRRIRADLPVLLAAARRLDAAIAARLAVFDTRDLATDDGFRTAAGWLRGFARLSGPAAAGLVKRARTLHALPALAAAAHTGQVNADHIATIAALTDRVGLDPVRQVEQILADTAATLTPTDLRRVCERIRAHTDPDGPHPDAGADFTRRALTLSRFDEMILLRGQLDPEAGATLQTALDALTPPPGRDDPRSPAQRRADALTQLARHALNTAHVGTLASTRPHLTLLITPDRLTTPTGGASPTGPTRQDPTPTGPAPTGAAPTGAAPAGAIPADALTAAGIAPQPPPAWLTWIGDIPADLARRLACDADLTPLLQHPDTGQPLYLGRTRRLVPAGLRKALHARDRGCRWPACPAPPAWTDAHHSIAWHDGGPTDIDHLLLLCRWHHHLIHEGHWKLHLDPTTAQITITRPDGRPYELDPDPPHTPPPTTTPRPTRHNGHNPQPSTRNLDDTPTTNTATPATGTAPPATGPTTAIPTTGTSIAPTARGDPRANTA